MITKQALLAVIDAELEKRREEYEADPDLTSVTLIVHFNDAKVGDTIWRKESRTKRGKR